MAKDLGSCLVNVFGAGCTILIITALPIAQITIGALYLHECPAAPVIPAYVTVCGALVLLLIGLLTLPKLVCPGAAGSRTWTLSMLGLVLSLVVWVLFGSFHIYAVYPPNYTKNITDANTVDSSAVGPVLALDDQNRAPPHAAHTWMTNDGRTSTRTIRALAQSKSNQVRKSTGESLNVSHHCDRTVYLFAFWTTTLAHVLTGVFLVVIVCLYVCMKVSVSLVEVVYS